MVFLVNLLDQLCASDRAVGFVLINQVIREVVSDVEGKITMKITIEAEAVDTESAYLVNNCQILVGKQFSLILPEMYAVGYCIDLSDNQ